MRSQPGRALSLREASDRSDRAALRGDRRQSPTPTFGLSPANGPRSSDWAPEARGLARQACAPYLLSIAGWADAARIAASGRSEEAVDRARAATGILSEYGERYRAVRLLVDLIPFLEPRVRPALAEEAAAGLVRMGAVASASEARLHAS